MGQPVLLGPQGGQRLRNPSCYLGLTSFGELVTDPARRAFAEIFNAHGYVIVRPCLKATRHSEDLGSGVLGLGHLLGSIQPHQRSNPLGVSYITNRHGSRPDFIGTMSRDHPLHTDGPYESVPPRLVVMQCLEAAPTGGETLLFPGHTLVRRLLQESPLSIGLLRTRTITVRRAHQRASFTVLSRNSAERLEMRYRYDNVIEITCDDEIASLYRNAIPRLLSKRHDMIAYKLRRGEVIVLDNTAVLHGRTSFSGTRCLARLWFRGDSEFCRTTLAFGFDEEIS